MTPEIYDPATDPATAAIYEKELKIMQCQCGQMRTHGHTCKTEPNVLPAESNVKWLCSANYRHDGNGYFIARP